MMGGLTERIRKLNNYHTIFGSFWFNILCVSCNLCEIITTVVLLGFFHNVLSVDYMWWPSIEMLRLFILTILRFDVMLKGVDHYSDNRNGFKYTKRMILLTNLIGFFFIVIGGPIYLALLSTPANSLYDRATVYTLFLSIYPSFMFLRALLSVPMFCTLITGTNPIWPMNQGYQRIDDAVNTRQRRTDRRQSTRTQMDGNQYQYQQESQSVIEQQNMEERAQRERRREWRLQEMERRQMELAIDNSRRDAFRSDRRVQDEEYERALKEAEEEALRQRQCEREERAREEQENSLSANGRESPASEQSGDLNGNGNGNAIGMASDDAENAVYREAAQFDLEPMAAEVADSAECVGVRVRLPNGERIERRFHFSSSVAEIVLWTHHECVKHNQAHLIGHSQLISTMPHTEYDDMNVDLKTLKFWRPNAKRKLVSPLLYVEEL